ncbi:unnamed protein product [Linum tenue]|uniref:Pyrroline-5-carboxylate reductase catalytic N-terminal domain-containing protein n=1 Tax=Linum tenue TaxID=586396 RepID=A0AAV0QQW3_9ROSI|nr:unnamed protein product [Linum tenue]
MTKSLLILVPATARSSTGPSGSCLSGLASKLLARTDSRVLVMVGVGALALHLIRAPPRSPGEVIIWNRTQSKVVELAERLNEEL